MLARHAQLYKDEPFQLEEISKAALAVSRKDPVLFKFALKLVDSIFPTGEELVDEKLTEMLCRDIDADEANAVFVAKKVASMLAKAGRDRYNSYEWQCRAGFFRWLHGMPPAVFLTVKAELMGSALALAEHDPWEACHYANVFSHFDCHQEEAQILEQAARALKGEKSTESLERALRDLQAIALANAAKRDGQLNQAAAYLSKIQGSEK
jgi:hypothetical protein